MAENERPDDDATGEEPEDLGISNEPGEEAPPGSSASWIRKLSTAERIALVGAVATVVAAVVAVIVWLSGGSPQPIVVSQTGGTISSQQRAYVAPAQPGQLNGPSDFEAYALSRSFWSGKPTVFTGNLSVAFNDQFDNGDPYLDIDSDTDLPYVATVAELADSAPSYEDGTEMVVGRIATAVESTVDGSDSGIEDPYDVKLISANGKYAIYGLLDGTGDIQVGAVVYVPVAVIATGRLSDGSQTSFFVGLDLPSQDDLGQYALSPGYVRSAAKAFQRH